MAHIFKEYDIRGIAEQDFDANFVYNLGKALATYYKKQDIHTCAIAMDCRVTSPICLKSLSNVFFKFVTLIAHKSNTVTI